jgi:hypothetical protein
MYTVQEVKTLIQEQKTLVIAAAESVLRALPRGNWIGGTTPYFMGDEGGCFDEQRALVKVIPGSVATSIAVYDEATLPSIALDAPDNGCTFVIIPLESAVHRQYAEGANSYADMFMKPVVGWIAGMPLDQAEAVAPKVVNGQSGELMENAAVALHITLPEYLSAQVNIVNIFTQGHGDVLTFPATGFEIKDCLVNGRQATFAAYLKEHAVDLRFPLVADYHGAMINTSFQRVDEAAGVVHLYAPVFSGIEYRLAQPVSDYAAAFATAMPENAKDAAFACNCILNYLYGELEGKQIGLKGPITFGEIAYQLVNQTLVYVTIERHGDTAV